MYKKHFATLILLISLLLLKPLATYAGSKDISNSENNSSLSLIAQLTEQGMTASSSVLAPIGQLLNGIDNTITTSETYQSIKQFWYNDIFGNFFNGIAQAISQFFNNLQYFYLPSIITWLCNAIKQFFLNADLTKTQNTSQNSNDLSYMLNQFNGTINGIALDLSLLLFILSIWRYWVDAAWKGSTNLMSPVGRLIFAMGTMLAWPTIYSFQIQLSNELMNALFMDNNGNIQFLDLAMARLFDSHNSSIGNIFSANNILALSIFGTNYDFFVQSLIPIVLCFLAIILICQLTYVIILKAIQTALMTAQYVFAPIFLVLLTNPITDNIATGYIRTFVEVSLWNFIWIGLLKILVILLYSSINPWGKILTAIGILQIMMDVPQFLAHAKISVASDFVSPRFFVKAIKEISAYDKKLGSSVDFLKSVFNPKINSKASTSDPSPKENNFSFANNNNDLNLPTTPPIKKSYVENTTNPQSKFTGQNQTNPNTNSLVDSFTTSSNNMTPTIATASINNRSESSVPSKKSGSDSSGFKSNSPSPITPPSSASSLNHSPTPINPSLPANSGMELNPIFATPKNEQLKFNSSEKTHNSLIAKPDVHQKEHTYSAPPLFNPKDGLNVNHTTDFNQKSDDNKESSPSINPNISGKNLPINTLQNPPIKLQATPLNLQANNQAQNTDFIGAPALIFNQLYAFHTGAMNYHLQKSRANSTSLRGYFPAFNKSNGSSNPLSGWHSHNLIFSHGNIPTLMGIPPIYPEANKT